MSATVTKLTPSSLAAAKLRFLRLAFGAGGSAPGIMGVDALKTLINDMYEGGKAAISWSTTLDGIEKDTARLLLNLAMLAVQAVPRGGEVVISASESAGTTTISLAATGSVTALVDGETVNFTAHIPTAESA